LREYAEGLAAEIDVHGFDILNAGALGFGNRVALTLGGLALALGLRLLGGSIGGFFFTGVFSLSAVFLFDAIDLFQLV
jgi:hypothetical protein